MNLNIMFFKEEERRFNTRIYSGVNRKGERVSVWATKIFVDWKNGHSIAKAWLKSGFITEKIPTYWSIECYVTDIKGNCFGRYNPQIKTEDGRQKINFEYILPASEENLAAILNKVNEMAEA